MEEKISLVLGGDTMLGRLVKEAILHFGADYPLGNIATKMRGADLTIINLECAITSSMQEWSGEPKVFYFGAPPQAINSLAQAGVDLVSLANNHSLDFNYQGLKDTFHYLQQKNIQWAGAGNNLAEALTPAILARKRIKFGMVAFCDHQEDFAATKNRAGMAYLDLDNQTAALEQIKNSLQLMKKQNVDYSILSLHWGPNMVHRPSSYFREFARQAIEMGYKMLFGHSAHVFQGIEIYQGCPIFYATGDLVDDYAVDYEFKNDHQLLFEVELIGTQLSKILLYPVFIENCQTSFAKNENFNFIAKRVQQLCAEMGTRVEQIDHRLVINVKN